MLAAIRTGKLEITHNVSLRSSRFDNQPSRSWCEFNTIYTTPPRSRQAQNRVAPCAGAGPRSVASLPNFVARAPKFGRQMGNPFPIVPMFQYSNIPILDHYITPSL